MKETEYSVHVDFGKIEAEVDKLQGGNEEIKDRIACFLKSLKETTARIEPTLSNETEDERELWEDYKRLQREKLAVLDLSHEWDYISEEIKESNPRLDFLVNDAIEELNDHMGVLAESHRAHIDILEIYNTRKIEFLALVITAAISYIAVWEFSVRDLLVSVRFPHNLSPLLNYLLVLLTLLPVFVIVVWAWARRKSYF
ncbi:MAG: hypothetical protein ACLQO7_12245 [Candidatus Bathyarchaeia archaeon]